MENVGTKKGQDDRVGVPIKYTEIVSRQLEHVLNINVHSVHSVRGALS